MDVDKTASSADDTTLKRIRLRYAGKCVLCGTDLGSGAEALHDQATRTLRCIECPPKAAANDIAPIEAGTAGGSAQREYERRKAAREARVKARLGNLVGGVALAITGDPQSTTAWRRGSIGERKLGEALTGVIGLQVLHDRRVPGTRGNIDHILVSRAGVFVVDAKRYEGLIRIRNRGGLFNCDDRLYVGSRDCSELAEDMSWQVEAVKRVVASADSTFAAVPVVPVLCFVEGEWPLLSPPETYKGVRLEGTRSIKKLVSGDQRLDSAQVEQLTRMLAIAFPAK